MKFSTFVGVLVISMFISGCNSSSSNTSHTNTVSTPTTHINTVVTPTTPTTTTPTVNNSPSWQRIYMHHGLLRGQAFEWGESGGYLALNVAQTANSGSYNLVLDTTYGLVNGQLITYRGSDNQYYTVTIRFIVGNTLTLDTALSQTVWAGQNAWNFYHDASHPNYNGYLALADH